MQTSDLQEQEKADRLNSALEGTVLAVLCVSLWLVLRRRRTHLYLAKHACQKVHLHCFAHLHI